MNKILNFLLVLILMACSGNDEFENATAPDDVVGQDNGGNSSNEWLINKSDVYDGGPGKDGIPSIDNPRFSTMFDGSDLMLTDEMLIIGIKVGNDIRAYPHFILDYHEIVNDDIAEVSVAITYCPLTGTATAWDRIIDNEKTSFGVSGLLFNNNLIPYDRLTDSNWSQILLQCVNGDLINERPNIIDLVETTWGIWKKLYPSTKVLNINTGFTRNYEVYPYGNYKENHDRLLFPLTVDNTEIPRKERVHAILKDAKSKVYRLNNFWGGNTLKDTFESEEVLIVGDQNALISFVINDEIKDLDFHFSFEETEEYFADNEGNKWNIFGEAISGPIQGYKLTPTTSFMAYWFSIGSSYPTPQIYNP